MGFYDELGVRMKTYYEQIPKIKLMRRTPVIIRLDGVAFHTFTRGFQKPFDDILIKTMQETTKYLCENIQGCVLGYTQSDEITLVLVDYKTHRTDAWFGYAVEKMCSVAASMATLAFNRYFAENVSAINYGTAEEQMKSPYYVGGCTTNDIKRGMFDARVFNIPKEEVTNCLYWRQIDASRNSIQMLGQAYFSQKTLENKSNNEIQDMLVLQKNVNWNNLPVVKKRGTCVIKGEKGWIIDTDIPIFKGEGRQYIEKLVFVGE